MTQSDIKAIIELFISWNGEDCPIDVANINSAVAYISKCLGVGQVPSAVSESSDFDVFWSAYDKKVELKKTQALWAKMSKRDRKAALAYLPAYKAAQPNKRYRKNPATFLRNRSWEDEIIDQTTHTTHATFPHSAVVMAETNKAEVRELSRLATAGAAALAGLVGGCEDE